MRDIDPILSLREVAVRLAGMSVRTVQRLIGKGELPKPIPVSPSGRTRGIRLSAVEAFIQRQERGTQR